jgi:F-type H+-transporting ATPase subunit b
VLEEAKAEADVIRERAQKNVEMEQERVKEEIRLSIIDISTVMAQKFVTREMDRETQDKLFNEVINELNNADFNETRAV